ncbi:MAG: hypothetical protein R3183_09115 [Oleiphilaceae bacterium]|nr:hypothetical protein [Oleiphilaceae bacterium]
MLYLKALIVAMLLGAPSLQAQVSNEQIQFSYTACNNITSEQLTSLQLYQRGVPLKVALETLPNISRGAQKRLRYIYDLAKAQGILNTYSDINTNFARCATLVHSKFGTPAVDQREYGYYYCAGENKRRFEIILYIDQVHTPEKLLELVPSSHHQVALRYFDLIEREGLLAAFDYTANNLKACLNNLSE